jgi:hypothetical protein
MEFAAGLCMRSLRLVRWAANDKLLTAWHVWVGIASIVTLIVGIVLVVQTITRGDLAVDAVLAQRLPPFVAFVLAGLWILPIGFAVLARWAMRKDPGPDPGSNKAP